MKFYRNWIFDSKRISGTDVWAKSYFEVLGMPTLLN